MVPTWVDVSSATQSKVYCLVSPGFDESNTESLPTLTKLGFKRGEGLTLTKTLTFGSDLLSWELKNTENL